MSERTFKLVSVADLPPPPHREQWGRWHYRPNATLELLDEHGHCEYEIDLERCATSAAVLDWIAQIAGKGWVSPEAIGHLVQAFDDTLRLQSSLCGLGLNGHKGRRIADVKVLLARRGYDVSDAA